MRSLILLSVFFGSLALAQTSPPPQNQADAPPPKAKHVYTEEDMEKYHSGGASAAPDSTSLSGERLSQLCSNLANDPKVQQQTGPEEIHAFSRDCPKAARELITDPRVVDVVETLKEQQAKICTLRKQEAVALGKAQQARQNTASIQQQYSGQITSLEKGGAYQRKVESVAQSLSAELTELKRQAALNPKPSLEAQESLLIAGLKGMFFAELATNHFYTSLECVVAPPQKPPQ